MKKYKITGNNIVNPHIYYFVNNENNITVCHIDPQKRPNDMSGEKIFTNKKTATKFLNSLYEWRMDVNWTIENI